jgi:hypothetical protein
VYHASMLVFACERWESQKQTIVNPPNTGVSWKKSLSRQARCGWVRIVTICLQDTAGSRDTARSGGHWVFTDSHPCANVRRFIHRLAHLAGVHKRGAHYASRRGPRRRAQTWCSLFSAPCASLFFAPWTSHGVSTVSSRTLLNNAG